MGGDRRRVAAERIYDAATDLIAHEGVDAFDIDTLATRVHCSRATIYRYVGGKAAIRDAVAARAAAHIIETVRQTIENLTGPERIVTAITVALKRIRSDPLVQLMITSARVDEVAWITASPWVAGLTSDLTGHADPDPQTAQWLVRVVLLLLYWPVSDGSAERQMVQRFIAPAFGERT